MAATRTCALKVPKSGISDNDPRRLPGRPFEDHVSIVDTDKWAALANRIRHADGARFRHGGNGFLA